ncbi:hypothetical protein HK097_009608, partial [Rhizophlyctis rosea]
MDTPQSREEFENWVKRKLEERERHFAATGLELDRLEIPGTFSKAGFEELCNHPLVKHLRPYFRNGTAYLKERPSAPHAASHGFITKRLISVLSKNDSEDFIELQGSTRNWWNQNRSKEADQSFAPTHRTLQGIPCPDPTLVVEVGYKEKLVDLEDDARGWLTHTETRLVLIIKIFGLAVNNTFRLRVILYGRPALTKIKGWEAGTWQERGWATPALVGPGNPLYCLKIPIAELFHGVARPAGLANVDSIDFDLYQLQRD